MVEPSSPRTLCTWPTQRHMRVRERVSSGSAPMTDVRCLPELPRAIRLKYLTEINRWTTLTVAPVASLQATTRGNLSRSRLRRDLLCRYDIDDVASVLYRDRFGCWGFLDLWRTDSMARFSQTAIAEARRDLRMPCGPFLPRVLGRAGVRRRTVCRNSPSSRRRPRR